MKADVFTGFLTKKVKVYGTKKNSKPFELSGKAMRRVYPFLIASVMTFSGCGRANNSSDSKIGIDEAINNIEIYKEVVEKYKLLSLMDKEPLPKSFIDKLIENPNPPILSDFNYNHLPENQNNFWEIIKNGVKKSKEISNNSQLSDMQRKEYQIMTYKMLSQITRVKGTLDVVDIEDYNNLKSFLYFEKMLKYGNNPRVIIEREEGFIDERCEVFGRYYKDFEKFEKEASKYKGIRNFAKALYNDNNRFVLSYADSIEANKLSKMVLKKWLKSLDVKDDGLWYYTDVKEDDFANSLVSWHKRGEVLESSLGVDSRGDLDGGSYSPVGVIVIHELQHAMQKKPASYERPEDNNVEKPILMDKQDALLKELGPTLYSLTLEDAIYKKIHNLPVENIVEYGSFDVGDKKVSIGEVAVFFGDMMKKYPHKSVDKILTQKEVLNKLNHWGNGNDYKIYNNEKRR